MKLFDSCTPLGIVASTVGPDQLGQGSVIIKVFGCADAAGNRFGSGISIAQYQSGASAASGS